ncbi:MAG: DNA alkylation repair protein [Caedimonadaceae bacterium]|nr:MAG: DNA alkylation repair protein [Caedimonadaceae bacterium]
MLSVEALQALLRNTKDAKRSNVLQSFFKTGKGQYAEGDQFLGIYVPVLRQYAKSARDLQRNFIEPLLSSQYNEERLLGIMILHQQFQKAEIDEKREIFQLILRHLPHINNWNLVDFAGPYIFGPYFWATQPDQLKIWAESDNLWKKRLSIVSTHYFIKKNNFEWTLKIAETLMRDPHDLIHKAVGWMLREVGKRDQKTLETFLDQWTVHMPRTMLRYAIERLSKDKRQHYMTLKA